MVNRRGRAILMLVILLNVPFFFVIPWERILFDKEKVIEENSGDMVTVDMRELEPTGVYVWMEKGKPVAVKDKRPNWFLCNFYTCTQFYVYSGNQVSEETRNSAMRTIDNDNPWAVLIADDVFNIPDSGKVKLDLSNANRLDLSTTQKALEKVNKKYGLSGRSYIDCATPYSEALNAFRTKRIAVCFATACVECLVLPIILLIIVAVKRKKQKEAE
ncbi:MAG: hypothetical protein K6F26_00800 [Lachnospiraceae bacterium]|nr:hypothetical protein [Lachnospiraceae bacterium]